MALSLSKKRSKSSKRAAKELGFFQFILSKLLSRVSLTLLLLVLVILWSSTTTIISGHIVHVCVSSRKLNNIYCLSAGAQPNFDIPLPLINANSVNYHKLEVSIRESILSVDIKNSTTLVTQEIAIYLVQENNFDNHKLKVSIRESSPIVDIKDDKALVTRDIPGFSVQEKKNLIVRNIVDNNNNMLLEFESKSLNAYPDVKDTLALELVEWLKLQKPWTLNSGKDHVFVLGKVSWDFRRRDDSPWGSTFLNLEEMQNPIKLLIERQPWHVNDIGIPHPTYFHPHSDEDIISWQFKIIQSSRYNLVSFAGGARLDSPDSIRSVLINQCTLASTGTCKFQNCSSEGCIPVFFDPFTAYYQYSWHLPEDHGKYSMFIDQEEVRKSKVNVVEWLMKIPKKAKDDMRRYIVYEFCAWIGVL
ncbi:hypothetical protein AgCh_023982 [Apium graveolens]